MAESLRGDRGRGWGWGAVTFTERGDQDIQRGRCVVLPPQYMILPEWVTVEGSQENECSRKEGEPHSIRPGLKALHCPNTHSSGSQFSRPPLDGSVCMRQQLMQTAPQGQPGSPMRPAKSPQSVRGQAEAPVMLAASTCSLVCFRWVGECLFLSFLGGPIRVPLGRACVRGPRDLVDPQILVFMTLQSWWKAEA